MSDVLLPRGWVPHNHRALTHLIASPHSVAGAAVFDWDNTCIFNDIGDASFRWQLDQLLFRLPPDAMHHLLLDRIGSVTHLSTGVALAHFASDIRTAYAALWPSIKLQKAHAVRHTASHFDFRAKLGALYHQMVQTPEIGAPFAYSWLTQWFGGFTAAEVQELARNAAQAAHREPIGEATWQAASPGRTGLQTWTHRTHVAPHPEMRDLFSALARAGIATWVVTASYEPIVHAVAALWHYPIPPTQILGMRLQHTAQSVALPYPALQYPVTYRQGKVDAIERFVGAPPILVAGDAMTDYEMLTYHPATCRLLLNRNSTQPQLAALCALGQTPISPQTPLPQLAGQVLLQGRDENTGAFVPTTATVALKASAPSLLQQLPTTALPHSYR
jgi:phosphoserine phosphatase